MIKNINHSNVIHYGTDALVIKTESNDFSKPVCLKVFKNEYPTPVQLRQYENEFQFSHTTDASSVRKALKKTTIENHPAIVFEYIDGADLKTIIGQRALSLSDQLQLAADLAGALSEIHRNNIIHQCIHPSNVLVEKGTHKVYLIDFKFATNISVKLEHSANLSHSGSLLQYISPEQTGRINRTIDYRTDLYSLGVILYELFTGSPPFTSKDPLELIYAHLVKVPSPPHEVNTGLPLVLSAIILKLLAKNAEDRYQSALGVKHDLEICKNRLQPNGSIEPFEIAANDFSGKIFTQQKLYGREKEIEKLFTLFENAAGGVKQLLLVFGYDGSGKSALISEVKKPIIEKKALFIQGKFEQFQHNIPYAAFIQSFTELVNFILTEGDAMLLQWKNRICEAVGRSGKILTDLIPNMEKIIGKQPEMTGLKGIEDQNRFNYTLTNFINAICTKQRPLVLFIDDLQWADFSSLNLLSVIMEDRNLKYFFIIGTYRNNELHDGHPLKELLDDLQNKNIGYDEIKLENLSGENVSELVYDVLHTGQQNAKQLSDIIYNKTKGNPFYVHQFLKFIYEEKFLFFDFEKQEWQWNSELIMQMNVSGNVVDLMTSLIRKLPQETIELLKLAACIGNRFSLKTLSIVKNEKEAVIENELHEPLAEGIIVPAATRFKFAHDRVQQAVYSLIPEAERKAIHLYIGKALANAFTGSDMQEHIFDVVNQWNFGAELIDDEPAKDYLCNLNFLAGQKARSSTAYTQALQYFEKAISLLDNQPWATQYEKTLALFNEATEAAYFCGNYQRVESLTREVLQHSKSQMDSVKVYEVSIQKLIAENNLTKALHNGLIILKKLGIRLPKQPGKVHIFSGLIRTRLVLKNKSPEYILGLPEMTDPVMIAAMRILSEMASAAYFGLPNLMPLLIFKMVQLSVKYGLSPKSPTAFVGWGFILSVYLNKIDAGITYGQLALDLIKRLKADALTAPTLMSYNVFLVHWKKYLPETIDELELGYQSGLETGDYEYTSYLAHNIVYHSFFSGSPLREIENKAAQLNEQIEKFKQDLTIRRLQIFRQSIANLIYETKEPHLLNGSIFNESENLLDDSSQNRGFYQNLYLQKMVLAIIFNEDEAAYQYANYCQKYNEVVKGSVLYALFYFYQSLAISSVFNSSTPQQKNVLLRMLKKNLRLLKKYESWCEKNYRQKRLLVEAEFFRIINKKDNARSTYDEAIRAASENHMLQDLAVCWEKAGCFYLKLVQMEMARFYLNNAMNAYHRWGADAKVKQMATIYEQVTNSSGQGWSANVYENLQEKQSGNPDLASVIKASTALSGEIVLSNLLGKLMHIILENAGAQHGYFIMNKDGELFIEAESSSDRQEVFTHHSKPVAHCGVLAESIVKYVDLTQEIVILDSAMESPLFANDEYIKSHQPKSILCLPFVNHGRLQGIIYLSNDLIYGAFTEKRLALLRLLTGQIAISIENALFYDSLEQHVLERTNELQIEKKKSDDLLLNILPAEVADELKQTGRTKARRYNSVTVMFTDFKDFTVHSEKLSPEELVAEVDMCFRKFDEIISKYNLEKIKTIGDAYLCVGGLPNPNTAENVVRAGLDILHFVKTMQQQRKEEGRNFFEIRIGIHTGPVVAGVVGDKKFAYDIWGDTVNTAARMEQGSDANRINISHSTYDLVKDKFNCLYRGKLAAKNKGHIDMYFVEDEEYPFSKELLEKVKEEVQS